MELLIVVVGGLVVNAVVGIVSRPKTAPDEAPQQLRDAPPELLGAIRVLADEAGVPLAFATELAAWESSFRPDLRNPQSGATGLFQIVRVAHKDWQQTQFGRGAIFPESYFDPDTNARAAAYVLRRAIKAAREAGATVDWSSEVWASLLVAGWNAGWSRAGGLAKGIAWARRNGLEPTVELLHTHAREIGLSGAWDVSERVPRWRNFASRYLARGK